MGGFADEGDTPPCLHAALRERKGASFLLSFSYLRSVTSHFFCLFNKITMVTLGVCEFFES